MKPIRHILPPVHLALSLGAMTALDRWWPVARCTARLWRYAGLLPIGAGVALACWAAAGFWAAGTAVVPFRPATAFVTGGPYRLTRNPMYVGMAAVLAGAAMAFGSASAWLPVPWFIVVVRARFILGEEAFLEQTFGEPYRAYCRRVRRWL